MRFKQAILNVVELFTFCHRFEQYLCSVCEFERGGVSMGHYFRNQLNIIISKPSHTNDTSSDVLTEKRV